ncbi:MAG: hypothetical protein R3B07_31410 [Polyangiaceae bacterium]
MDDDDAVVATFVLGAWQRLPCLEACDGEEGLAILMREQLNLDSVVSDVVMLKMNWPEFIVGHAHRLPSYGALHVRFLICRALAAA